MKSGLEGRNNITPNGEGGKDVAVSMKSGLEGRNNPIFPQASWRPSPRCLNEVRPRRPEQLGCFHRQQTPAILVSMKSGLEGRNNPDDDDNSGSIEVVSMKSGLEGRNNEAIERAGL